MSSSVAVGSKALKRGLALVVAGTLIGGGLLFLVLRNQAPSCIDSRTKSLVIKILHDQFHMLGDLSLKNIRVLSGSLFGTGWKCEAQIAGITDSSDNQSMLAALKLLGMKFDQVRYDSTVTADTHRQYVTARLVPFVK